jgi:NTP pyrophosphatase (non-canonical NTP hydrolase)
MALTFKDFQQANLDRCEEGFRHSVNNWSLLEWAGAAAGEMGEAANICKKLRRQEQKIGGEWAARDLERAKLLSALADEIGDVLAYLSLLASAAGIDMGEATARKFDHVSDRIEWAGVRLVPLAEPFSRARTDGACR